MVHEPKLKPLLEEPGARSSRWAATLIAAANEAGGRDNITVILFRLEEVDDRRGDAGGEQATIESDAAPPREYETFAGEALEPRQGVTRPDGLPGASPTTDEAEYRRHGTVALQALRPGDARLERAVQRPRPASHRRAPRRCPTTPAAEPPAPQARRRSAPAGSCSSSCSSSCRSWSAPGSRPAPSTSSAPTRPTAGPSRSSAGCPTSCRSASTSTSATTAPA